MPSGPRTQRRPSLATEMAAAAAGITPSKAGERLGVSAQTVRRLCNRGELRYVRTPLGRLINVRDVEKLRAALTEAQR